jgi:hypothetical protein
VGWLFQYPKIENISLQFSQSLGQLFTKFGDFYTKVFLGISEQFQSFATGDPNDALQFLVGYRVQGLFLIVNWSVIVH